MSAGRSPVVPAWLYAAIALGLLSLAGSAALDKKKLAETNAARYIITLPDGKRPPALQGGF